MTLLVHTGRLLWSGAVCEVMFNGHESEEPGLEEIFRAGLAMSVPSLSASLGPVDYGPPGSSVMGFSQARMLE